VGDARYSRRDNGLVAAEYAPAGDVDPRVGEHLLDILARDGIAAYLRPSSDQHPITRSTTLPQRPVDRLYVDRAHVATARDHLARLAREEAAAAARAPAADVSRDTRTGPDTTLTGPDSLTGLDALTGRDTLTGPVPNPRGTGPGLRASGAGEPSPEEVDRAFAEIVAGFGATTAPDAVTGRPDGTESTSGLAIRPDRQRREPEQAPEERSLLDALDTFGADLPDDDPGEFVPPEPPPVPRPALPTVLAVIGVVGGLAVFLQPRLLSFLAESLAMFVGFAMVVAGSAALVWRLRPGSDDDHDPDQGARV
jgi:hypothetical protein